MPAIIATAALYGLIVGVAAVSAVARFTRDRIRTRIIRRRRGG